MEKLKFVGDKPKQRLRPFGGDEPLDVSQFMRSQRQTFRSLFRTMVIATLRASGGMVGEGVYSDLPPQHGAWERLEELIDQHKFHIVEITRADEYVKNEAVYRIQLALPTLPQYTEQLFTKPIADGQKPHVLVSFYMGVCEDFTRLQKPVMVNEDGSQSQGSLVPQFIDGAFDPDKVVPVIIGNLRLEHRYLCESDGAEPKVRLFYQAPEGFIYRIDIDGYVTLPS